MAQGYPTVLPPPPPLPCYRTAPPVSRAVAGDEWDQTPFLLRFNSANGMTYGNNALR